jgi:hypothetical protein
LGDALHLRANPEEARLTWFASRTRASSCRILTCRGRYNRQTQSVSERACVISVDALCRDLLDWETLYISGRTQKPVRIPVFYVPFLFGEEEECGAEGRGEVDLVREPDARVVVQDLDLRVGENPHKVRNIVAAQLPAFRSLYGGLIKSFWKISVNSSGRRRSAARRAEARLTWFASRTRASSCRI